MEILPATAANICRAAEALRAGEVVAYPTETVYGFGVDPFNEAALAKLYAIKQRDPRNPVLLIVSDRKQLAPIVTDLDAAALAYADAFWPGPLSMLLRAAAKVPESLLGSSAKICVRVTSHPIAAALCEAFGGAIVSTSANLSAQPPARRAAEVPGAGVAVCIEVGEVGGGIASTILDPETGAILREGSITLDAIARIGRSLPH